MPFLPPKVFSIVCPIDSLKLQHLSPDGYKPLAPPVRLFDFDWATTPTDQLELDRTSQPLRVQFCCDGMLTAFIVYFNLDLDGSSENMFDSGPSNEELIAWDQSARYLPVQCKVCQGQAIHIVATHTRSLLKTLTVVDLSPEMIGDIGHTHIVGNPAGQQLVVALNISGQPRQ